MNNMMEFSSLRNRVAWPYYWVMAFLMAAVFCLLATLPAQAKFDAETAQDGVVRIVTTFKDDPTKRGYGSGFIVSDEGHVVTNLHVLGDADAYYVYLVGSNLNNPKDAHLAEVLDYSGELDFAILKVENLVQGRAVSLNTTQPNKNDVVYAFGFPMAADELMDGMSVEPTLTKGVVGRSVRRETGFGKRTDIQHDASVSWGNSGGPLFNECGEVIGVNTQVALIKKQLSTDEEAKYIHAAGFNAAFSAADFAHRLKGNGVEATVNLEACTPDDDQAIVMYAGIAAAVLVLGFGTYLVYARQRRPAPAPVSPRPASRAPAPAHHSRQRTGDDQAATQVAGEFAARSKPSPKARDILCTLAESGRGGGTSRVDLGSSDFADPIDGCVLGRSLKVSHLQAEDGSVSRRHARIKYTAGDFVIEDLNSSNGTFVNDKRLEPFSPAPLPDGAVIRLGSYQLTFSRKA